MEKTTTSRWRSVLPYALLVVAAVILLVRSFYGFSWSDESHVISLVDRLYRGDAPFYDLWDMAQLIAPLLLPFYSLYHAIAGGSDGIVLFFRILYVVVAFCVALVGYRILRHDFGRFTACCISLIYLFSPVLLTQGLTAYSLSTAALFLGIVFCWKTYKIYAEESIAVHILSPEPASGRPETVEGEVGEVSAGEPSAEPNAPRVLYPFFSGVLFALATVCNPCILFLAFITFVVGGIYALVRRSLDIFIPFLWGLLGAFVVALCYLWYLFVTVDPGFIFPMIPQLLADNYAGFSLYEAVSGYLTSIPITRISFLVTCALCALLIALRLLHQFPSERLKMVCLIIDLCCLLFDLIIVVAFDDCAARILLAFVEFAIALYFLNANWNPARHPEILLFWLPGLLLSLVWQFSSAAPGDTYLIGYLFIGMGATITVTRLFPEQEYRLQGALRQMPSPDPMDDSGMRQGILVQMQQAPIQTIAHVLTCVAAASIVVIACVGRSFGVYDDVPLRDVDRTIADGPAAGLMTSGERVEAYEGVRKLLAHTEEDESVWIAPEASWAYLDAEGGCAMMRTDSVLPSQEDCDAYFALEGHDVPEWILVVDDSLAEPVDVTFGRISPSAAHSSCAASVEVLRDALALSTDYGPVASSAYGTLYRHAHYSYIASIG
ncbi:MAG: hypothetical protein LUD25_04240 [Coriobacteriaceae bacterium]|nr:hypothetical protein [Coriobacteriaceae bacterium]